MPRILHILTRPDDALALEIIARQKENNRDRIQIVDLRTPRPDYADLLEKIFAAESVESW
ncbi:MAG TPA: hypothetical protein VMR33_15285 [Candidatus Baltobacteraceae bacterium]|jgi:hypothetical protein|nr:hypothetical protein [Candidatus Baltobacteraceae bacterium]